MPGPAIGTAVVAFALASGCVAAPQREGVGGYCHRDDQCLEGLRCLELVCRGPGVGTAGDGGSVLDSGIRDSGIDGGAPDAPDAGP
jgi:hypothetical protein